MSNTSGNQQKLGFMFFLTFGFFLAEIIVGYLTGSMALVADSFHMLSDVIALVVAFISVKMSPKKWSRNTFGWARAEVLGALVNAVFLLALCFSILVESIKRFIKPEEIYNPPLIMIVGGLGLVVNLIGLVIFRHSHGVGSSHSHGHGHHGVKNESGKNGHIVDSDLVNHHNGKNGQLKISNLNLLENPPLPTPPPNPSSESNIPAHVHQHNGGGASQMNMHGVFLHLLGDALGSVVVLVSALVIYYFSEWEGRLYVDPALSVLLVGLMLITTWPLLKESALVLLQAVPHHLQIDELHNKLVNQIGGVMALHEFHVWQLAGDRIVATAHVHCRNMADYTRIAEEVKTFFHNEGIHSTTMQLEFFEQQNIMDSIAKNNRCYVICPFKANDDCGAKSCCGSNQDSGLVDHHHHSNDLSSEP